MVRIFLVDGDQAKGERLARRYLTTVVCAEGHQPITITETRGFCVTTIWPSRRTRDYTIVVAKQARRRDTLALLVHELKHLAFYLLRLSESAHARIDNGRQPTRYP